MATKNSLAKFKESLQDKFLELLWRQWRTLGVASHGQETNQLIDLESLILGTAVVAEHDRRLWESARQWLASFHKWVNQSRLKRMAATFIQPDILLKQPLIKNQIWEEVSSSLNLEIGSREKLKDLNHPRIDRAVMPPLLKKYSLLQLYLRGIFGINARAEMFIFLLLQGDGNSNQIARETNYDQKNIYIILERWVETGFISRVTESKQNLYALKRGKDFLPDIKVTSTFWNWSLFFQFYSRLLAAIISAPWATDTYLLSSFFRDIGPQAALIAKEAGIFLPDPNLLIGEDFSPPMARALLDLLDYF